MKRIGFLGALVALWLLSISGAAAQGVSQGSQNVGLVTMNEQNGSGENGGATFSEVNGKLVVSIDLSNGTSTPQPAHIHTGTCANLDPAPAYPLNPVVNGKSVTTLDVSLATLMSGTYAVNVHKSATEITTYVSCGDLTQMARAGGVQTGGGGTGQTGGTVGMPSTGSGETGDLLALLGALALGLVGTGVGLARRAR